MLGMSGLVDQPPLAARLRRMPDRAADSGAGAGRGWGKLRRSVPEWHAGHRPLAGAHLGRGEPGRTNVARLLAVVRRRIIRLGFGTARNLEHYGAGVERLTGLDPMRTEGYRAVEERIARARFPVEHTALRARAELPFDAGRFDCIVTTWTRIARTNE